jgi:hypothetical protein
MAIPVTGAATSTPSALWPGGIDLGFGKVTMTTMQGASLFGSASVVIYWTAIQ